MRRTWIHNIVSANEYIQIYISKECNKIVGGGLLKYRTKIKKKGDDHIFVTNRGWFENT